jgi:ribosome-associated protein
MIRITDQVSIDDRELDERFVRASGPGGQNVNKVSTAVELRFDIAASSLPDEVKARLRAIAASRVTADGILLIDSREHRTQLQNRVAARERLADLVLKATRRPRTRKPTRPSASSKRRRLETKKRRGTVKDLRSRKSDE